MALKSFYKDQSEIPEGRADFYAEQADGSYVLNVEDIDHHPKVRGVITANNENRRKAAERQSRIEEMEARLGAYPEDFDKDEWERLRSGANDPSEQVQLLKDQHQRAIEGLRAKHQADLDLALGQVGELNRYIDSQTRASELSSALDEANFDPTHKPMLTKFLADQVKVKVEDGKRIAYVETDLGDLSPIDFVRDFAAKDGKIYLSKAQGPSAQGNNGGGRFTTGGNIGGNQSERTKAIANKFPELPQR